MAMAATTTTMTMVATTTTTRTTIVAATAMPSLIHNECTMKNILAHSLLFPSSGWLFFGRSFAYLLFNETVTN